MTTGCAEDGMEYRIESKLNPYEIAPLSAELYIKTEVPSRATVEVLGLHPVKQSFYTQADSLVVPVIGLYPDRENKVAVTLEYEGGSLTDTVLIKTSPLPSMFPDITINKANRDKMEAGLHHDDYHLANHGVFRSVPMIFDDQGQVRWYMDLGFHGKMVSPFQRLQNGSLFMVGRHVIYEFDMMGRITQQLQIDPNFGMHHDVYELPNRNLIICVGRRDAFIELNGEPVQSDSDFMIHFDRSTFQITGQWDMRKHLDVSRDDLNFFRPGDWLHMNGLAFDQKDGSIFVSAKNQGLIKISWNDELKWILSPKKNWGRSGAEGDGFDTRPYLLTALDKNGEPYSEAIQMGDQSADDFDFPWGPHAPKLLPNGNLILFDNGTYRNFDNQNRYSRAVEYEIDNENRTVKQVWQYGKERGEAFFSAIVSDVDYLTETGNVLVTSGYISPNSNHSAKIVEVDYETKEEVFEATLYFKTENGNKTARSWGQTDILYRSQRMPLKY